MSRIHSARGTAAPRAPDPLRERARGEREPDGHEHLLDRPAVERPDQDELDERSEQGADREPEEPGHDEAQRRVPDPAEVLGDRPRGKAPTVMKARGRS